MSQQIVYLNGSYLPIDQAKVSVLDRGFIFGDGVYEVIPAYGGHPLRLKHHLQRLQNSLDAIRLENPHSDDDWSDIISSVIGQNEGEDQYVYLQVTRGVAKRDHSFPDGNTPTVFVMSSPLLAVNDELLKSGVSAITLDDIRWRYCSIKTTALLANVLLRQQAVEKDAAEAILVRDGEVTEGAASNLFIVLNGVIITPPKSNLLLPGITRDLVVELAHHHDLPCEERSISADELKQAEEVWVTSSTKEILPVTMLDGKPVGNGTPGTTWQKMLALYQENKQRLREGQDLGA
ncbi:MAG: D-amino acid aminotransferase [Gammaproteobacteria bacterium]